jgi:hypothetical protein
MSFGTKSSRMVLGRTFWHKASDPPLGGPLDTTSSLMVFIPALQSSFNGDPERDLFLKRLDILGEMSPKHMASACGFFPNRHAAGS